jgi:methanogenic corrinoid protein MtbC1
MLRDSECSDSAEYSVGDLAALTGIRQATLRVWERRYGFPIPIRKPSGHRVYRASDLERVMLIVKAMRLGLRAGDVVPKDPDALRRLVGDDGAGDGTCGPSLAELMDAVTQLDAPRLERLLASQSEVLGPSRFASECLAPFVDRIGDLWMKGKLDVHHEHFASEVIQGVVRGLLARTAANRGPLVLLTTLPGEQHALGLLMAALSCTDRGLRVLLLGAETPNDDIVAAVKSSGARAVGISVSESTARPETTARLRVLRARLPGEVELLLGGSGSVHTRRGLAGVHFVHRPEALGEVLDALVERCGSRG